MQFISFEFLLFAAAVLIPYYTVFRKAQWIFLLAASYVFYLWSGPQNLIFIVFTTLSTHTAAVKMAGNLERLNRMPREERKGMKTIVRQKNRIWLVLCLTANFALLAVCKVRFSFRNILLPMGISFYMFQSMGYLIDVYRGSVPAERNPLRLALFTAYFPQLIQGPISKFSQLAPQLFSPHGFDGKQLSFGLQRMLWGFFKKLVIADRIAVAVAALKAQEYTGVSFLVLTVFYAVQIYGDFTGGIDIALGFSQALGIELPENFVRPFFSKNIAEYWRRWHITLGVWMKDYIFYPISVSAPLRQLSKTARRRLGKFGKRLPVYAASAATWFVTGIWHGMTPNFLVWGMFNSLIIVVSEELTPLYQKFHNRFHMKERKWYGLFETVRMFCLMNLIRIVDLFPDVGEYVRRMTSLLTTFNFHIFWDGTLLNLGLSGLDYGILTCGVGVMLGVSLIQERKGSVRAMLWKHDPLLRYGLTFALFLTTLLMGCYGIGYDAGNFIYNQF